MKRVTITLAILAFTQQVFGQNEIGPEGHKLLWLALFLIVAISGLFVFFSPFKLKRKITNPFTKERSVAVRLVKDRLYYPDSLELIVENTGAKAVDIEQPLLVFSSMWLKRKFRLKGTNNASFYPLYLDKGQSHSLNIDLNRFYAHSKSLKGLPKAKVILFEANGRKLGSQSVFLRKTLFKY